jgi:hypothetical protein
MRRDNKAIRAGLFHRDMAENLVAPMNRVLIRDPLRLHPSTV